jgi:predicted amidohydrolase YtcJ
LPRRAELDAVDSKRPILLQRVCGHVGVVNSVALARATVGPFTDVETGRVAEDDLYAVNDLLRPSAADLERVLPQVAATLHAHGITQVHDVMPPELLAALAAARAAGRLAMRVSGSIPARYLGAQNSDRCQGAAWFASRGLADVPTDRDDPWLRVLGIKLFLDGSLGARTAALRAPYADEPATRGSLLYETEELRSLVQDIDAAGLQLMVHAIGDRALDQALEVLEPLAGVVAIHTGIGSSTPR